MFNCAADLLDRIEMQLRSSHERLTESAEAKRGTDICLRSSRRMIDDSRRLLISLGAMSDGSAEKQRARAKILTLLD